MSKGIFKKLRHEHHFKSLDGNTIMTDIFEFESPLGIVGKIFNKLMLTNYLKKFIKSRNLIIKEYAETDKWKEILPE